VLLRTFNNTPLIGKDASTKGLEHLISATSFDAKHLDLVINKMDQTRNMRSITVQDKPLNTQLINIQSESELTINDVGPPHPLKI
jgi:selenocysteine-specific translation elongation factor